MENKKEIECYKCHEMTDQYLQGEHKNGKAIILGLHLRCVSVEDAIEQLAQQAQLLEGDGDEQHS